MRNLTLKNIQVNCEGLSDNDIEQMRCIVEKRGYLVNNGFYRKPDSLLDYFYFKLDNNNNEFYFGKIGDTKTTITYEKFMELFGNKEEFDNLLFVLNEELTEEYNKDKKPQHPLSPVIEKAMEMSETINKAYKETSNKLNYELDFNFITQLAERMAQNKHKYEPYNWQRLDNIAELKQALYRHVMEVMKGNYADDNRLFGHLESIALNAMFINYQLNNLKNK